MKLSNFKLLFLLFSLFNICITNVNALSLDVYTNEETNFKAILEDDATLLSFEELERLKNEMIPLTKYGNIIFKTINDNKTTTERFAMEYYHSNFDDESGTLFLIDMTNRYIYIFSDGDNYNVITDEKALVITDNSYAYATNKEYYKCASKAISQIQILLDGGRIAEPMRYISNLFISITLSAFISFTIVVVNTKVRKASDQELLDKCNITFEATDIKSKKIGVTKIYSPINMPSGSGSSSDWDSSSSSSGSSSSRSGSFSSGGSRSSGSSGSRSSGGGGGHRF